MNHKLIVAFIILLLSIPYSAHAGQCTIYIENEIMGPFEIADEELCTKKIDKYKKEFGNDIKITTKFESTKSKTKKDTNQVEEKNKTPLIVEDKPNNPVKKEFSIQELNRQLVAAMKKYKEKNGQYSYDIGLVMSENVVEATKDAFHIEGSPKCSTKYKPASAAANFDLVHVIKKIHDANTPFSTTEEKIRFAFVTFILKEMASNAPTCPDPKSDFDVLTFIMQKESVSVYVSTKNGSALIRTRSLAEIITAFDKLNEMEKKSNENNQSGKNSKKSEAEIQGTI